MEGCAVTLVLIVHNTAPWLDACIDSIAAQNFDDLEILAVDVDSDDDTKRILHSRLTRLPRAKVITETSNIGGAAAANRGIQAARGTYVFLMDSDDVLPAGAIAALHSAAESQHFDVTIGPALSLVGRRVVPLRYQADVITWCQPLETARLEQHPELTMAPYYWGRLYRRSMLIEHHVTMREGRLFADRYFTCHALSVSRRIGVIPQLSYLWRRDHTARKRGRSVTQRFRQVDVLQERIDSFADVESLFDPGTSADLLRYVRLSNLMRSFIHTKNLPRDALRAGIDLEPLERYARSFSASEVASCEFLLARHKLQWQLIVENRWEDLAAFHSARPRRRAVDGGASVCFDYGPRFADVPTELRTQFASHIAPPTFRTRRVGDTWEMVAHTSAPEALPIHPVDVTVPGRRRDRDVRIPVTEFTREGPELEIRAVLPSARARRMELGYVSHGRYHISTLSARGSVRVTPT